MKKIVHPVVNVVMLAAIMLVSFTATAFAAGAATGDDGSILDLLRPVYDAFRDGHYVAAGALAVVLLVALIKRYAPGKIGDFVHSDAGGAATTLMISFAGTIAAATGAGQPWTWSILWISGGIAFAAAGGYAVMKKLVIEPMLASSWYQDKVPSWAKAMLAVVLWVFDSRAGADQAIAKAEKDGADAVAANPGTGADAVAGKPEKF